MVEDCVPLQVQAVALWMHERGRLKIGGLGYYDGFTHIDVRAGSLVIWDKRSG